jgi:hypothetical protein
MAVPTAALFTLPSTYYGDGLASENEARSSAATRVYGRFRVRRHGAIHQGRLRLPHRDYSEGVNVPLPPPPLCAACTALRS